MIESLYEWLATVDPILAALIATTFTWLLTAAGAALVFPKPEPAHPPAR